MTEHMTSKERWLAAIHMTPVDRLPFWPKIYAAYSKAQVARFRDMDLAALHKWIGSDPQVMLRDFLRETRKHTSIETTRNDDTMRTVYRTPHGEMALIQKFDEPSQSWHPVEFPVRTPADIKLMTEFFEDVELSPDTDKLETARGLSEKLGRDAFVACNIGESPLMYWVEWLAGIETAHYLLADHQADVEHLFAAIHRALLRRTELLCELAPADVLYLTENTSTTLISPDQYRRYCVRHIGEYAGITNSANRPLVLHMCGHLKALLEDLARVPTQAFEAFTSPTVGNTTLRDGRTACPDKCLIGGTNAVLWTRPAEEINSSIKRDLDELPHHRGLVITSAGVMPPLCKPETIREVCEWVKHYPADLQ